MLEELKQQVLEANRLLPKYGLVTFTWGNVSGIDREKGLVVIKPSGIEYGEMDIDDLVVVDMEGHQVEGHNKPSTDTPTHLVIYKAFSEIGGIAHTHSIYATSWAQAGRDIPCYGTTHADYIYGSIPCTRSMTKNEIEELYEENTGHMIVDLFLEKGKNPMEIPAVCRNHGPFTWGRTPREAVYHTVVLEEVAKMAFQTELINSERTEPISQILLDKHYLRKHGENAYYGQNP